MPDSSPHSMFREFCDRHTLGGLKVIPIYRKMGTIHAGADAFERARDIEEVLDALPGLVEQLEAAAAALHWVADNYPKAMREMPTDLYQPLRAWNPAKAPGIGGPFPDDEDYYIADENFPEPPPVPNQDTRDA